ncbi:MAG: hypothetical protein A3H33_14285 [Betaproteobacteria bacterium RIFCSPLOWO2_02_FULL_65_20]|nr:MAG: hypothetical protein A3H33_14285 [Betaproteobacteria bacterium RIFCSPLOWO2_02_FULL_65_20]
MNFIDASLGKAAILIGFRTALAPAGGGAVDRAGVESAALSWVPDLERIVAVRAWLFMLVMSAAAQVFAQAPVEERRPARDDAGLAQRRVDFARQALEQAEAQVRDAAAAHEQAQSRFDEAKAGLDATGKSLARARAAAAEARKRYDAASSELERRQAGK